MKSLTQPHTKTKARIRGNKRSKDEQARIMNDIFSLSTNHNDLEIMNILKIPNETFYRYKSIMYEEARKIWKQICKESIEYRALHMINSINLALKVNQEIALDSNNSAKDRLEAAQLLVDQQINFINLLRSGPELTPNINTNIEIQLPDDTSEEEEDEEESEEETKALRESREYIERKLGRKK